MASYLFGKKSSKNSIDYKSRLEHKLYLARENPEPVFDLSECNLKSVPSGVYSLCKVFRKERLLLQVNHLVSLSGGGQLSDLGLITYLDLHNNHISTLSEDIGYLKNLQELNVSNNELKSVPSTISSLTKLEVLDCSHNQLRGLPQSFDHLRNLNSLDLRGNTSLPALPSVLTKLPRLEHLYVDSRLTEALPPSLVQQGTSVILQYLSKECNPSPILEEDCKKAEKLDKLNSAMPTKTPTYCQDFLTVMEKKKQEKAQDLLAVERQLREQKGKEFDLHTSLKQSKDKLLLSLIEQDRQIEDDVNRFHIQKEQDRSKLLSHLVEVEKCTEEAIGDLLLLNQALRSSQWQENKKIEQKLLLDHKTKSDELHRKEVLDAMESLLLEEYARKERFLTYEKTRGEVLQNSLAKLVSLEDSA